MSTTFNRVHDVLQLLHQRNTELTLSEIMDALHIPPAKRRTMQLTMNDMVERKLLIKHNNNKHKRHPLYSLGTAVSHFPDMIEGIEKLSFYIAKAWLEQLPISSDTASHASKNTQPHGGKRLRKQQQSIRGELDRQFPGHIFDFSHAFGFIDMKHYVADVVNALMHAITKNIGTHTTKPSELTWLTITTSKNKPILIAPYFLFFFNGELYVACYSASVVKGFTNAYKGAILNFALRNIHTAGISSFLNSYEIKPRILPYKNFRKEFHSRQIGVWGPEKGKEKPETITLVIDKHMAEFFANRFWHTTQNIEWNNEEKTSLTLTLTVPITNDLITWVWQWHPYVRVVEPPCLIEKILEKAQQSLQHYQQKQIPSSDHGA